MRLQHLVFALSLLGVAQAEEPEKFIDFEAAKVAAGESGRDILVEFTGTDWCNFCKDMRSRLFQLEAFREWMAGDLVWMEVDYIRNRGRLQSTPLEFREAQDEMRRRFDVRLYPTVYLCDGQGRPYALKEGFLPDASTEEYFFQLAQLAEKRKERDALLAKLETSTGADRLPLLEKALSIVPARCVEEFYPEHFAELQKGRPDSPLVTSLARERELAALEKGLRKTLASREYEQTLAGTDALLDKEGFEGETRQRFLLVKAHALMGMEQRKEASEVIKEIIEIDSQNGYAGRAKGLAQRLRRPNPRMGEREKPQFGSRGQVVPGANVNKLELMMAPMDFEEADLATKGFTVLKSYRAQVRGRLGEISRQIDREHKQWEELYFKQQALVEERGADHPGVSEFDRIIGGLKKQHEATHRRERELKALGERVEAELQKKWAAEQAAGEAEARKLLEEAGELRDSARELLEKES